jgi:DNA invertase Pin-like site-specific DNA recombinase
MKHSKSLAYSYLRFSHPDQAKGDSLRRQTELRDAWLARNHAALDTSLTLEDKGVSAFNGDHRGNPDRHALAAFVSLVTKGRISRGSYLIVENLDRLSREDIIPALSLLLDLIQSGIRVVQLIPVETVYDAKSNPMHLMMAIMELSRGHSESAMKSERVGGAWRQKKRRAAENGEPLTARAPAWLRLVDGEWEVVDSAVETIQCIFRLAIDGYGMGIIVKRLNAEHVPVIGHARHWARSYVAKLLNNRAVVGEYQPFKGRAGKRQPDGKPIPKYYPAIIAEDTWYAARAALASRRGRAGRPAKDRTNVFSGLLFDARSGGTLQRVNKGKKSVGPALVPYQAFQGVEGTRYVSFPFSTFEQAVFSCLREIDQREILPRKERGPDQTQVLAGRLAEVESEIEKLKARLLVRYTDALADVLERQEAEKASVSEQISEARQEAATPLNGAWHECGSLLDVLHKAPDAEELRVKLRAALRRIVEGVWCLFVARGATRIAAVQIWFTGGAHRDYLIVHRAATGGSVGVRPAKWWARSLVGVAPSSLDLRRRKDAEALEAALNDVDLLVDETAPPGPAQETGRTSGRAQQRKSLK